MSQSAKILIVDDQSIAVDILSNALEGMGEIIIAMGGAEALAKVANERVDLILLDALMPDMDGFTTCRALQRDYPNIPVIFVTVVRDESCEVRALEAGAIDFINKPINPVIVRARVAIHLKLKHQNDLLRSLSSRDPLTGIANRRTLEERLAIERRRSMRYDLPLSVLMIDIDYFKAYNDYYGHLQGDECLCRVAQCIVDSLHRGDDLVARYGGEEFAVLLPGIGLEVAGALANKIRGNLKLLAIPQAPGIRMPYVTISIGVATSQPVVWNKSWESSVVPKGSIVKGVSMQQAWAIFDRADRALYAAKAAGRDCVRLDNQRVESGFRMWHGNDSLIPHVAQYEGKDA